MLAEPLHVQVLSGQAHEQTLLRAVPLRIRKPSDVFRTAAVGRRRRGAAWLLAVWPIAREWFREHAPPSIRKK